MLRKHLVSQPAPSSADAVTLPPAALAVLQNHIDTKHPADVQANTSSTMTTALVQRTRVLMDENNELYDLLRIGETGKLKEEVYLLKGVISRLERALKGIWKFSHAGCVTYIRDTPQIHIAPLHRSRTYLTIYLLPR